MVLSVTLAHASRTHYRDTDAAKRNIAFMGAAKCQAAVAKWQNLRDRPTLAVSR